MLNARFQATPFFARAEKVNRQNRTEKRKNSLIFSSFAEEDEYGGYTLPPVINRVFASVVEDFYSSLLMLRQIYTKEIGNIRDMKFDSKFLEDTRGSYKDSNEMPLVNYYKLQVETNILLDLMSRLYFAMRVTSKPLRILTKFVEKTLSKTEDEDDLFSKQNRMRWTSELSQIRSSYERQKVMYETEIRDATNQILKFQDDEDYNLAYGKEEIEYVNKWEAARREQNSMKLDDAEGNYNSTVQTMERKSSLERRCHQQITNFLEETRNDYMSGIQDWMTSYEGQMEEREANLYKMKVNIDSLLEEKEYLQKLFDEHRRKMDDWLAYKQRKKDEEQRIRQENWAATKIQAWWRGVMVKKKLGPYRKQKKGKGKDKGKKKK